MMTHEDVETLITQVALGWNNDPANEKVWVLGALPGDWVSIPNYVRFQSLEKPAAGMAINLRGYVIVLNQEMVPKSWLSTFFHELGHVKHRQAHGAQFDEIESESWAVKFSLERLETQGYEELAYREADAVKAMATVDPYRSAVELLKDDPIWLKYSRREMSTDTSPRIG
jgi:hypothetical protein